MVSAIDPTVPVHGFPTTASVRGNFQIAHDEISALQAATANGPFLPIIGGEITGNLQVDGELRVGTAVDAGYILDVAGSSRFTNDLNVNGWIVGGTDTTGAALLLNGPTSTTRQILWQTAGVGRVRLGLSTAAESGSNAGGDFRITTFTDAGGVLGNPALQLTRASGNLTLGGGVDAGFRLDVVGAGRFSGALTLSSGGAFTGTFSGAHTYSGVVTFSSSLLATSGPILLGGNTAVIPTLQINGAAASQRIIQFLTAGVLRWRIAANATAEGGANAGSDLDFTAYDDTGAVLGNPAVRIARATGMLTAFLGLTVANGGTFSGTFSGTHTYSGAITFSNSATVAGILNVTGGTVVVGTNTSAQQLWMNGPAGANRPVQFRTAGLARWQIAANAVAEGGANAGSDLDFTAYDDTGVALGNPVLRIARATGLATAFFGLSLGSTLAPGGNTDLSRGLALFASTYGFNVTSNRLNYVAAGTAAHTFMSASTDIVSIASTGMRVIGSIGFNNTAPIVRPTVSGAWAGNTAGKALCTALASYGLITDSTTA